MDDSHNGDSKKACNRTPPLHNRFRKGESGNAKGRPPKSGFKPVENILKKRVTVPINGKDRKMPLNEALLRAMAKRAIEDGDVHATQELWKMSEGIRVKQLSRKPKPFPPVTREIFNPAECEPILKALGIIDLNKWDKPKIADWVKEAAEHRNPTRSKMN